MIQIFIRFLITTAHETMPIGSVRTYATDTAYSPTHPTPPPFQSEEVDLPLVGNLISVIFVIYAKLEVIRECRNEHYGNENKWVLLPFLPIKTPPPSPLYYGAKT